MTKWSKIVVGVDGSKCSLTALRWAAREAYSHGAELFPIAVAPVPPVTYPYGGHPAGLDPQYLPGLRAELEQTVTDVIGTDPGFKVLPAAVQGNPAKVLIDLSEEADLVVVGTRGHGGFAGKLLGSVSRDVATHAACTAVIVRGPR